MKITTILLTSAALIGAAFSATIVDTLSFGTSTVNPDGTITFTGNSFSDGAGGFVDYDILVTQYTGSSFSGGSIVHGTALAPGSTPAGIGTTFNRLLDANNAGNAGTSITVDIINVTYDNTGNGFTTPGLAFNGFLGAEELQTGGSGNLVAHNESTALTDLAVAPFTFSTPQSTFEFLYDTSITGTHRIALGGLALIARRRRA